MRTLIFIITALLVSFNLIAQDNPRDSLLSILKHNKADTTTVKALYDYGDLMQDESSDSAIILYEKAYAISKKINYLKGIGDYYRSVTYYYGIRKGDTEKALKYADEFLAFAEKHKSPDFFSKAYFAYAVIYQYKQLSDSAVYFYEKCIPYFLQTAKKINTAIIYNNLASLYDGMELADKSIEYANKAMRLAAEVKDTSSLITAHLNISNANVLKKDTPAVFKNIKTAYQLSVLIKNDYDILNTASNLASTFRDMGQYDSAFIYFIKANEIAVQLNITPDISDIAINLADYYAVNKNWDMANEYLQRAIKDTANFEMQLSKKMLWYRVLSRVQAGTGNYKDAMRSLNVYIDLYSEEILREKTEKSLAFDERLKKAAHDKALLQKEIKIKKQQTQITALALGSVALLGTGLFFILYQKNKQQLKNRQIESLQKEKEFIAVKSSLEGQLHERIRISKEIHDELGSSLTSISLLTEVLKKRVDTNANPEVNKISDTSADMVDKMNEIIWALNTSNDTVNSLVAYVRKFTNNFLQDANMELEFLEMNIPEHRPLEGTVRRNIYLTVKEAVNNIVKHSGAKKVIMEVDAANGLQIKIKDDGKGIDADNKLLPFKNGLINMKKRMEDIGGTLTIENNNGTLIKLTC
jgi:signal transduction histidine kinase